MSLEAHKEAEENIKSLEGNQFSDIDQLILKRSLELSGKIEHHANLDEESLEHLPQAQEAFFTEKLENLKKETMIQLKEAEAAATVAIALENIQETLSSNEVREDPNSILSSVETIIKSVIEKEKDLFNERTETLQDNEKGPGDRATAALELATKTPILSKIVEKKIPLLSHLSDIIEIREAAKDPEVSKEVVIEKIGRLLLSIKTLGLSEIILFILKTGKSLH